MLSAGRRRFGEVEDANHPCSEYVCRLTQARYDEDSVQEQLQRSASFRSFGPRGEHQVKERNLGLVYWTGHERLTTSMQNEAWRLTWMATSNEDGPF
jgi:hypothetical protein